MEFVQQVLQKKGLSATMQGTSAKACKNLMMVCVKVFIAMAVIPKDVRGSCMSWHLL